MRRFPVTSSSYASAWNNHVHMRVKRERLSPRVQNADDANFRSQMLGVSAKCLHRSATRFEEDIVHLARIILAIRVQLLRYREHDVEVRTGQ